MASGSGGKKGGKGGKAGKGKPSAARQRRPTPNANGDGGFDGAPF